MFVIWVTIIMLTLADCLLPLPDKDSQIDEEIKTIVSKYISKIPDVEPQFVINQGLSKVISRYFKQKVSTFPLYRISLKLDRNPVKIPWSLADPVNQPDPRTMFNKDNVKEKEKIKEKRTYKYVPAKEAKERKEE